MATMSPTVSMVNARDASPTVQGSAAPTAPTAGATILTLTAPTGGNWELTTYIVLTVAGAAADANNVSVTVGGVAVANVPVLPAVTTMAPQAPMIFALPAGGTVILKAVGNATATSVYNTTAVLRQVS